MYSQVKRMFNLKECLQGVKTVAILGHIRPDGDCIGSCLALYNYIETYFPQIEAKVYLQDFLPEFLMLKNAERIIHDCSEDRVYDICFSLDSADKARHGEYVKYFDTASTNEDFVILAKKACKEDATEKATSPELLETAKKNTEDTVKSLIAPVLDSSKESYGMKIEWGDSDEE